MATDHRADNEQATRAREALAEAGIAGDLTFVGLGENGGFGPIEVRNGAITVPVTLPLPGGVRERVERDVRDAALAVDGIESVTCRFAPDAADAGPRVDFIPDVKNVVAVASGKGGVGKSTVAVNVAVSLAEAGADVGLLDADVYGPNAPAMLGLGERSPDVTPEDSMVPREAHGVRVMSMGFVADEDDPVIWRGPLVDEFVKQLFGDVAWGELDYLIVDLPPGTGDVQLSLVQHLPVAGAVVVTTPQAVAVDDARRGLRGFEQYDVPVLGIAANMAGFECPDCGSSHDIFDAGGAEQLSDEFNVPLLGRIPVDPAIGTLQAEVETEASPGISLPVIGRLQLPRTREERERPSALAPVALRDGDSRRAFEMLATRTAARIETLAADHTVD